MSRDEKLKQEYKQVKALIAQKFTDGIEPDLDAIIYLVGVQELGKGYQLKPVF